MEEEFDKFEAGFNIELNTERAILHAIQERIPIVVVLNKVDRLIDELRLPPNDAYDKLRDTIKVINNHITAASSTAGNIQVVDPALGNVCFASASSGWSFTLHSFAKQYVKVHPVPFDANELASHLWGDFFFNHVNKEFKKKKPTSEAKLSFVQFVLEPLYKLHSQVIKEDKKSVEAAICELGSTSTNADYRSTFDSACGFIDMLVEHIPSAKKAALEKVEHIYTGPKDSPVYEAIEACDTLGPTMVNITKMYPKSNGRGFDAFGRVFSGEITTGQTVQVLGEDYSPSDEEHRCMQDKKVTKLWIYLARHRVRISKAVSGSWVLIEGVDNSIMKTATLCSSPEHGGDVHIFKPLQFNNIPVVKVVVEVATEPLNTTSDQVLEMIKMGLTNVSKSYPLAIIEFKESGRHTISGSGELYLDSTMRDLTELLCSKVELKFGDPFVLFCATSMDTSSIECFAENPNKKIKLPYCGATGQQTC